MTWWSHSVGDMPGANPAMLGTGAETQELPRGTHILPRRAQFMATHTVSMWGLRLNSVLAEAPHVVPARWQIRHTLDITLATDSSRCRPTVA